MHQTIFAELSLIIALSAAVALVMRLIRQPLIIGHIMTGIIVGPSVLHLIKSPQTIEAFSNIGIALLLFIIGLGLNPKVVREVGKVAGIAGMTQVLASAIFGWATGRLLGLPPREAVFFGVALSFSSTIIILKLLSDKKEQSRLYGKITIGILLLQDILATIALLMLSAQGGGGFSANQLLWLAIKGLAVGVPVLLIGNVVLPRLHKLIAGSQEFLFLFAIGWGFGTAALFEATGFSLEIGALLAGIALAGLPYTQEISARLRPLRDFFIVVFFISLGTRIDFGAVSRLLPAVIIGSLCVIVLKPLIVLTAMGLLGHTKRNSFKTAIALAQVSEFSLVFVILANKQGLVSNDLVAILTMIALASIAISTYLIIYSERLFLLFERYLTLFELKRANHFDRESRRHYELVLFGYQRGGHEFLKVFESLKKRYVVVDYDPEVIDGLEHAKIEYLYGDAADIELLEEIGLDKAKLVVSTITDHETNVFLVNLLAKINSSAVLVCHADTVEQAEKLYELGAAYVMLPHYIGSEKISAFIRKSHLKKSEFRKFRQKHLEYLQSHYVAASES